MGTVALNAGSSASMQGHRASPRVAPSKYGIMPMHLGWSSCSRAAATFSPAAIDKAMASMNRGTMPGLSSVAVRATRGDLERLLACSRLEDMPPPLFDDRPDLLREIPVHGERCDPFAVSALTSAIFSLAIGGLLSMVAIARRAGAALFALKRKRHDHVRASFGKARA